MDETLWETALKIHAKSPRARLGALVLIGSQPVELCAISDEGNLVDLSFGKTPHEAVDTYIRETLREAR